MLAIQHNLLDFTLAFELRADGEGTHLVSRVRAAPPEAGSSSASGLVLATGSWCANSSSNYEAHRSLTAGTVIAWPSHQKA